MKQNINEKLDTIINETLLWADDLSEKWTGTMHEKIINIQKERLLTAVGKKDSELAQNFLYDLAQTLEASDQEYEKIEG